MKLKYLSNLKVKYRLAVGFGIILSLLVLLTILGIQKVNFIDSTLYTMTDINSVKQRYAINYRGSVHDRAIAIRDISIARTLPEVNSLEKEVRRLEKYYQDAEVKMNQMIASETVFTPDEQNILSKINQIKTEIIPIYNKIISDKKLGINTTDLVLDSARPAFISWLNAINEFIDYQESLNQELTPKAQSVAGGFQELMLWLSVVALIISVIVGVIIERSLRSSLGGEPFEAEKAIKAMAQGELVQKDLLHNREAYLQGSILDSLSDMSQKLVDIVSNIVTASQDLSIQVNEVSQGSSQVLEAARQQASLTKDTAGKLEEMHFSIDQVSQIARQTESNSEMTASNAHQGRELVFQATKEMEKIATTVDKAVKQIKHLEDRTKEIGGIANVISAISEQTNLLALNAAIEAARAGDSGRGFAVVADEVRKLAQRTGEATAQIDSMIHEVQSETAASVAAMETTQPQVKVGQAQISQATELLSSIEEQAADSLNRVREVAQATAEQVNMISEISTSMDNISAMSGESIQSMQSNNRASDALSKLATLLKDQVSYFKV